MTRAEENYAVLRRNVTKVQRICIYINLYMIALKRTVQYANDRRVFYDVFFNSTSL